MSLMLHRAGLLRPYAGDAEPSVPDAFETGDWSIARGNAQASVTISELPANGGASITGIEYRLDGGSWISSGGTGNFNITSLSNGTEYDVELRAVNSVGAGAASDEKQVTPATVPAAFDVGDWEIDPGDEEADVTIDELPDDGGDAIIDIEHRLDGGGWTSSGGVTGFTITGLTNDTEYDVELRAVNSVGAGTASDTKSVTPEGDEPTFHPLNLTPEWFFDAADVATLFAERTGTPPSTQAGVDGVVGSILNQGSAGGYIRAPADGNRALKRQDGSYFYIEPDGSDDHYLMAASLSGYDLTIVAVIRNAGTTGDQRIISFGRAGNSDFADAPARTLRTITGGGLIVAPLAAPSLSADANPQVVAMHCQFGSPRASLARNGDAPATTTGLWAADMSTVDQLAFFRNASGAASGIWSSGRLYMLFVKIGIVTGADLTALVAFAKSRAGIT